MERINVVITCNDNECPYRVDFQCAKGEFFCIHKLKEKLEELIDNESMNIVDPKNTYQYINVIPVNKLYELLEEL